MRQSIAVIGTGISGLVSAWNLSRSHDVTLFEANDYPGGHTHTHDVVVDESPLRVDTGFIVYNERTYPHFIALLNELGCSGTPTEMSFSVRDPANNFEYNGHNLNTLFAQRRNIVRPSFLGMIRDIMRFNREVRSLPLDDPRTLGQYLDESGYGVLFRDRYIIPMAAAIWSTGDTRVADFPIGTLARFFDNHGLLDIRNRPRWFVVDGGSASYVEALLSKTGDRVRLHLNETVERVERAQDHVTICSVRGRQDFDLVVLACHSDQALALLAAPTREEKEILGSMTYTESEACLHTDTSLLPLHRRAWAAWNYHIDPVRPEAATLTYNMNILQHLPVSTQVLVTLNDGGRVDESRVIKRMRYAHPFYNQAMVSAQARRDEISGRHRTFYAGAYWRYGFHEDGVMSALDVCERVARLPAACPA